MALRDEILRQLTTEYQQTKSPVVFAQILKRVDKLLLSTIHKLSGQYGYLRRVSLEDLYHTAIIGLSRALNTAKDTEDGNKLVARIIAYVKCEIHLDFRDRSKEKSLGLPEFEENLEFYDLYTKSNQVSDDAREYTELALLRDEYSSVILYNVLSKEEWKLLTRKIAQGHLYKELAKEERCCEENVRQRVGKILTKIRKWFEDYDEVYRM